METVSFLLRFEEIWRMASFISSNREVSPSNADILKELSRIKFTDTGVSILYPVFTAGWNKIRATKIGSKVGICYRKFLTRIYLTEIYKMRTTAT